MKKNPQKVNVQSPTPAIYYVYDQKLKPHGDRACTNGTLSTTAEEIPKRTDRDKGLPPVNSLEKKTGGNSMGKPDITWIWILGWFIFHENLKMMEILYVYNGYGWFIHVDMVYFMENPNLKWIKQTWGYPYDSGHPQVRPRVSI